MHTYTRCFAHISKQDVEQEIKHVDQNNREI